MQYLIFLSFLVLVCLPHANATYSEDLVEIDSIRLSNPERAKEQLLQIPITALEIEDQYYYRYLEALVLTWEKELSDIIGRYNGLLLETRDSDLKIRILGSLINLLGARRDWKNGLQRVEELLSLLQQHPDSAYRPDAYLNLAHFQLNIHQPETALHFAERVFASDHLIPRIHCGAYLVSVASRVKLQLADLTLSKFTEAERVCGEAQQTYTIVNLYIHKVKWLLNQSRFKEAETVLINTQLTAETFRTDAQIIDIYSLFSLVYLAINQYDDARDYADKALSIEFREDFPEALISAFDVKRQLAEHDGAFEEAYEYLVIRQQLEKDLFERQLADEIAIQQARFDIDSKQSEIELLDKQNELLKAESLLINERLENSLLALALVSLLLSSLIFWSFRSRKIQAKLRKYARTDALVKIANRGYFTECFTEKLEQAKKSGTLVGLILLDLDHFKNINDSYGHQVGDWALIKSAKAIKDCIGDSGLVGRLGGEEFGVVISGKRHEEIMHLAERCRQAIENIQSSLTDYQFKMTVSIGVSNSSQAGYKLENLYAAADLALYQSKHYGRNRVYEYSSTMAGVS